MCTKHCTNFPIICHRGKQTEEQLVTKKWRHPKPVTTEVWRLFDGGGEGTCYHRKQIALPTSNARGHSKKVQHRQLSWVVCGRKGWTCDTFVTMSNTTTDWLRQEARRKKCGHHTSRREGEAATIVIAWLSVTMPGQSVISITDTLTFTSIKITNILVLIMRLSVILQVSSEAPPHKDRQLAASITRSWERKEHILYIHARTATLQQKAINSLPLNTNRHSNCDEWNQATQEINALSTCCRAWCDL